MLQQVDGIYPLKNSQPVARMERSAIRDRPVPTKVPGFRPGGLHPGYSLNARP